MKTMKRTLIISDSGTHGGPRQTSVYRLGDGRFETVVVFAGGLISRVISDRCPKTSDLETDGYWRHIQPSPVEKLRARLAAQIGPEAMRRLANPL